MNGGLPSSSSQAAAQALPPAQGQAQTTTSFPTHTLRLPAPPSRAFRVQDVLHDIQRDLQRASASTSTPSTSTAPATADAPDAAATAAQDADGDEGVRARVLLSRTRLATARLAADGELARRLRKRFRDHYDASPGARAQFATLQASNTKNLSARAQRGRAKAAQGTGPDAVYLLPHCAAIEEHDRLLPSAFRFDEYSTPDSFRAPEARADEHGGEDGSEGKESFIGAYAKPVEGGQQNLLRKPRLASQVVALGPFVQEALEQARHGDADAEASPGLVFTVDIYTCPPQSLSKQKHSKMDALDQPPKRPAASSKRANAAAAASANDPTRRGAEDRARYTLLPTPNAGARGADAAAAADASAADLASYDGMADAEGEPEDVIDPQLPRHVEPEPQPRPESQAAAAPAANGEADSEEAARASKRARIDGADDAQAQEAAQVEAEDPLQSAVQQVMAHSEAQRATDHADAAPSAPAPAPAAWNESAPHRTSSESGADVAAGEAPAGPAPTEPTKPTGTSASLAAERAKLLRDERLVRLLRDPLDGAPELTQTIELHATASLDLLRAAVLCRWNDVPGEEKLEGSSGDADGTAAAGLSAANSRLRRYEGTKVKSEVAVGIEGKIYCSDPDGEYAKAISRHLSSPNANGAYELSDASLSSTSLDALPALRLGQPYWLWHHGSCHHLFNLRSVRLRDARADPPPSAGPTVRYLSLNAITRPGIEFQKSSRSGAYHGRRCDVCDDYFPSYVLVGGARFDPTSRGEVEEEEGEWTALASGLPSNMLVCRDCCLAAVGGTEEDASSAPAHAASSASAPLAPASADHMDVDPALRPQQDANHHGGPSAPALDADAGRTAAGTSNKAAAASAAGKRRGASDAASGSAGGAAATGAGESAVRAAAEAKRRALLELLRTDAMRGLPRGGRDWTIIPLLD